MSLVSQSALQAGLYDTLTGDGALLALLPAGAAAVTAFPAPDLDVPYVLIAQTQSRPAGTQMLDASELAAVIEVYSRVPGGREAREIAAALAEAASSLTIDGHHIAYARVTDSVTRQESDGQTYVARLTLQAVATAEDTP